MLKKLLVIFLVLGCCYCSESDESDDLGTEAARAKKKSVKFWRMVFFLAFSKFAIIKAASAFLFMMFFQKFCAIIGMILNHLMRDRPAPNTAPPPHPHPYPQNTAYGPPEEYNTIGYSYAPSEHNFEEKGGLPSITEMQSFKIWPFSQ